VEHDRARAEVTDRGKIAGSGWSASLTRTAASRLAAPLETAIATASCRAESRSDGSATAAAA